jgi:hypothetical protein
MIWNTAKYIGFYPSNFDVCSSVAVNNLHRNRCEEKPAITKLQQAFSTKNIYSHLQQNQGLSKVELSHLLRHS